MKQIFIMSILLIAFLSLNAQIINFKLSDDILKKCTAYSEFNVEIEGYAKKNKARLYNNGLLVKIIRIY